MTSFGRLPDKSKSIVGRVRSAPALHPRFPYSFLWHSVLQCQFRQTAASGRHCRRRRMQLLPQGKFQADPERTSARSFAGFFAGNLHSVRNGGSDINIFRSALYCVFDHAVHPGSFKIRSRLSSFFAFSKMKSMI